MHDIDYKESKKIVIRANQSSRLTNFGVNENGCSVHQFASEKHIRGCWAVSATQLLHKKWITKISSCVQAEKGAIDCPPNFPSAWVNVQSL
jgi:hypothetical protein